jgi:hypothetical protein
MTKTLLPIAGIIVITYGMGWCRGYTARWKEERERRSQVRSAPRDHV